MASPMQTIFKAYPDGAYELEILLKNYDIVGEGSYLVDVFGKEKKRLFWKKEEKIIRLRPVDERSKIDGIVYKGKGKKYAGMNDSRKDLDFILDNITYQIIRDYAPTTD